MKLINVFTIICFCLVSAMSLGQQVISDSSFHLRHGVLREWSSFPEHAADSVLSIQFDAADKQDSNSISLMQSDVNQVWEVLLNDTKLGNLVIDEQRMITYMAVPSQLLNTKNNKLIIRPGSANTQSDDIVIEKIMLHPSAVNGVLSAATVHVSVGLPCRLTIVDEKRALQPVHAKPGDTLAIRAGVMYSGTGNFTFALPAGKYRMYASRGFEYGVDSVDLNLERGQELTHTMKIAREVVLKDWWSCDPHIHTEEYSGHGDATMKERVLTITGEGLDYAVITEHNRVVDITDTVRKMGMDKWFTPIAGNEFTTNVGHFNVFPSNVAPTTNVTNWADVRGKLDSVAEPKVVILNHARDVHNGFRPADKFNEVSSETFPVNAMEVMNSGSQQTEPRQLYFDWLRLISKGINISPVGSSDSHDVSRFTVGQARTYVRKNPAGLVQSFINRTVGVSFGLFTVLQVGAIDDGKVEVTVEVYAPSWIKPGKIILFSNGKRIYTTNVKLQAPAGLVARVKRKITIQPNERLSLVAIAEGNAVNVPWWPIAKPYQHSSPEVNPIVMAISEIKSVR